MDGLHSSPVGLLATGRSVGFDPLKALAHVAGGEKRPRSGESSHGMGHSRASRGAEKGERGESPSFPDQRKMTVYNLTHVPRGLRLRSPCT